MKHGTAALPTAAPRVHPHRPRMLFVSTRFLFPIDCGGRIRTVQILRGLKGGGFDVTLASPAPADWQAHFAHEITGVCDRFATWPEPPRGPLFNWLRLRHVADPLPVPVATDRSNEGLRVVAAELVSRPDLLVLDFPHAAVLAPEATVPTVVFTHNVEAEIFARHALHAKSALRRGLWRSQERKMRRFEAAALARCAGIVAVSERDQQVLEREYRAGSVATIRTGVDLEYFTYGRKPEGAGVVFTGSMDWLPNIDGLEFFLEQVWPQVARGIPHASMTVVGRAPPPALIEAARRRGAAWEFTGWVEDVRPYVRRASAFVIPLRIAGGTRLKVFEAMALGCPVLSTAIGVEGLAVADGIHYRRADAADELARALIELLRSPAEQERLARAARTAVETEYSSLAAARDFERICASVIRR